MCTCSPLFPARPEGETGPSAELQQGSEAWADFSVCLLSGLLILSWLSGFPAAIAAALQDIPVPYCPGGQIRADCAAVEGR